MNTVKLIAIGETFLFVFNFLDLIHRENPKHSHKKNLKTRSSKTYSNQFFFSREKEEEEGVKIDRKIDQKIDRSIASKFDAPPTINQLVVDPHTRDDHKNLRDTDNLPERPYYAVASPNNTPCGKFGMLKNTQILFQETHAEDVKTQYILSFSSWDPLKTLYTLR